MFLYSLVLYCGKGYQLEYLDHGAAEHTVLPYTSGYTVAQIRIVRQPDSVHPGADIAGFAFDTVGDEGSGSRL
jgi:hypothetical protein